MQAQTQSETYGRDGRRLGDRIMSLIHEGNRRRVVVAQAERRIAEFPLTVGVIGALVAPPLAAIGALAALLTGCSIAVEKDDE